MFDKIFDEYKKYVKGRGAKLITEILNLPFRAKCLIICVPALLVIGEIATYIGNNAVALGSAICMLCIVVSMFRDAKNTDLKSNEEIAIEYKNIRLKEFSKILLSKEIGSLNTPTGIETLLSCADERINKESLKFNNRTGTIVAGMVAGIFMPFVWKLFELYNLDEISWNNKIELGIAFIAVLIYSVVFIIALYPNYIDYKLREYNDLCDMKSDLFYMKYLYIIDPSWDQGIITDIDTE